MSLLTTCTFQLVKGCRSVALEVPQWPTGISHGGHQSRCLSQGGLRVTAFRGQLSGPYSAFFQAAGPTVSLISVYLPMETCPHLTTTPCPFHTQLLTLAMVGRFSSSTLGTQRISLLDFSRVIWELTLFSEHRCLIIGRRPNIIGQLGLFEL